MHLEVLSRQPPTNPRPTPLLFVHGASHNAWYWTNFLDYFAEHGYAAYAPNLRGHGGSAGRDRLHRWRLSDYVDDVAQVAAGLPRPPVVIGHSLGGLIVQLYLESQPAAAGILLASTPSNGGNATTLRELRRRPRRWLRPVVTLRPDLAFRKPSVAREIFFSAGCPDEIVDKCCGQMQAESRLALLGALAFGLHRRKPVTVPVLVIGGADDALISPAAVAATARVYGTEPVMIPGVPHHLMLDCGWPTVAERMLAWLQEQGL